MICAVLIEAKPSEHKPRGRLCTPRAGVVPVQLHLPTQAATAGLLPSAWGQGRHWINCSLTWLLSSTPGRQGKGNHLETPKLLVWPPRAGLNEHSHSHGRQESEFLPAPKKIRIRMFSFPNDSTAASRTPTDLLGVYLHAVLAYCLWV